ncbi:MAG: MFS transporter [Actinomycetota bacterium]
MEQPASLWRNRSFRLYWFGVVFSQLGVRGTIAVNLYHVFVLTESTALVGLVGLAQAVALLLLSPLGGAFADRLDRRRLLQVTQAVSMTATAGLALVTLAGNVRPWHIYVAVLLNTAAATFDQPARQALIPAMVPRDQLTKAFALLNPSREVAILLGPALGGLLTSVAGPEAMYLFDAVTYGVLIVVLAVLEVPRLQVEERLPLWSSIAEGVSYVRGRPIILQLMALDLSAMLFGAYRVVLPELTTDVLGFGAAAYGLLAASPSAGALLGSVAIFRLKNAREGSVVLASTAGYGVMCIALAWSPALALAVVAAAGIGLFDAMATTIRHAVVQLETPDELRGRVSSIYQMASRGGPAVGELNVGWIAGLLGPVAALSLGGLVPIVAAGALSLAKSPIKKLAVVGSKS